MRSDAVAACFAACKLGEGLDGGKKCYCPNGPNKGIWYDDYDAIPASCWEDEDDTTAIPDLIPAE